MLNRFYHDVYLNGYHGKMMPVWVRKLFARTTLHRAWLLGRLGFFSQDGVKYGPANPFQGQNL